MAGTKGGMNGNNGRSGYRPDVASGGAIEALWKRYCEEHLQPSRLFKMAVGLSVPDADERSHIESCDRCRAAFEQYRSGGAARPDLKAAVPEAREPVNSAAKASNNGHVHQGMLFLSDPNVGAAQSTSVPELLRRHVRVAGPVLFPHGEVAFETWQLGRIEQVAKSVPVIAEQISTTIVERAYAVLQPRLTRQKVVLVCFGRTLHLLGTRLAARFVEQGYTRLHVILAHDFYSPTFVCAPGELQGADVTVLVDVMHTGALLERLFAVCRQNTPARIRGMALIDQSAAPAMTEEVVCLWTDGPELRIPIERFTRTATAEQRLQLARFEPNDECATALEAAAAVPSRRRSTAAFADAGGPFIDLIHRAGALHSDYRIGQKRYPYVINVLDLLREPSCRERIVAMASDALADLAGSSPCLVYHAARTARAGRIAKALGGALRWPVIPLDIPDRAARRGDRHVRRAARHRTIVLVDAAVRTGDSLTAMAHIVDDLSLRNGRRIVAFCVLDALAQCSRAELAANLGVDIRTLFQVPLAPPTERLRNWMSSRKAAIRHAILESGQFSQVESVLKSYCERAKRSAARTPPATPEETLAVIRKAEDDAREPERAAEYIGEACRLGKVALIRHLPLDQVVHDRSVQSLLLGVMYNSMKPSFKESAVFALGAAENFEWMNYEWLQCNRPFLASPTHAWKSVLMIECQMRLEERTRELSRFRDALDQFSETLPRTKPERPGLRASQRGLDFGDACAQSQVVMTEGAEIDGNQRLAERVKLFVEVAGGINS